MLSEKSDLNWFENLGKTINWFCSISFILFFLFWTCWDNRLL